MFNGEFPKALEEEVFNTWLENGRQSKIKYNYLLVIWDQFDSEYRPVYVEHRDEIEPYQISNSRELLVAVYDVYSESRISVGNIS